jgi:hypothetical protein
MLRKRIGRNSALSLAIVLAVAGVPAVAEWDVDANDDDDRTGHEGESFPTGSVIYFHPDGTGANTAELNRAIDYGIKLETYFKQPTGIP